MKKQRKSLKEILKDWAQGMKDDTHNLINKKSRTRYECEAPNQNERWTKNAR